MTSHELATLSTGLWVVATVSLFILLAEWSDGGTWGLTSSIVQGVLGWSDRSRRRGSIDSPYVEPLRPMLDPYAVLRRERPQPESSRPTIEPTRPVGAADVEIVELGERHLD